MSTVKVKDEYWQACISSTPVQKTTYSFRDEGFFLLAIYKSNQVSNLFSKKINIKKSIGSENILN